MAAQSPKKSTGSGASSSRSRTGAGKSTKTNAGLAEAAAMAATWLKQPEVQAQLMDVGMNLAAKLKAQSAGRASTRSHLRVAGAEKSAGPRRSLPAVTPQRRLERRADRLVATVELLRSAQGEESSEALDQVEVVIGRVRLALAVAQNLPTRRRIAKQREIARALRQVEGALSAATGFSDLVEDLELGDNDDEIGVAVGDMTEVAQSQQADSGDGVSPTD